MTAVGGFERLLLAATLATGGGCSIDGSSDDPSDPVLPAATTSADAETSDDGHVFITPKDGGMQPQMCNLLEDPCPVGEKCSPYSTDGSNVPNATRCVPVAPSPRRIGEVCTIEDWLASGIDDCDRGLTCWGADVQTLEGRCEPLCTAGVPPGCSDPDRRCVMGGGPLVACLKACDPLAPDCPEKKGCYPIDDWLYCLPDASGMMGLVGEPCAFTNGCKPGLYCASAKKVPGCEAESCCTPFCAVSGQGLDCPGAPAQTCIPFFDDPPTGLDDVGQCATP